MSAAMTATKKLSRLRQTVKAVLHQLTVGEAADGDQRDLNWCVKQLSVALEASADEDCYGEDGAD